MKKTLKLFGLVALSAFVFSCTKEIALDIEKENITPVDEQQAETPDTPVIPATDGGLLTSFGVTFEGQQDADTKVSVDLGTGVTNMEEGDEVLVFVGEGNKAIYKYNGSEFILKEGETAVELQASAGVYYPADEFDVDGTDVKLRMPAAIETSDDLGALNPMAGVVEGEAGAYTVTLCNLLSLLHITVNADVNINSVTLDYGEGAGYATGAMFIVDASAKTLTFSSSSAGTSVNVDLEAAATSADVVFFLPTLPLNNGINVTANLAANHNGGTSSFSIANSSTAAPARKAIRTMSFYAGLFSGGTGMSEDPYIIANKRDFKYISKYCTEGYTPGSKDASSFLAANFRQVNDLNINEDITAYMIGSSENPFAGTYVGYKGGSESKTVLRLVEINASDDNAPVGIFRNVTGTIKHISVAGSTIKGNEVVGALVGTLDGGTVSNCIYSGSTVTGSSKVGGLVGEAKGAAIISDCETQTGDAVNPGNTNYVGGIVGLVTKAAVSNCVNKAKVTGYHYVGGIAGGVDDGKVYACKNNADVTATNTEAGGIVGRIQGGTIRACYTSDGILISGYSRIGGIAGYQSNQSSGASLIINCAAKSNIKSTSSGNNGAAGGLVGYMYSAANMGDVILVNSVALGSGIYNTWKNTAYLGAIVGQVNGAASLCYVRNCYSQHNSIKDTSASVYYSSNGTSITNTKQTYMGGIYGYLQRGTVQNCYCVGSRVAGINKTYATVGAGTKTDDAAAGNTRMVLNEIKNGLQAVDVSSWTFYPSGIIDSSATSAYLVDIMNLGTWETAINGDRFTYTSSEGTLETVCDWVGLNGTSPSSYDPAYPSELKTLGYYPQ